MFVTILSVFTIFNKMEKNQIIEIIKFIDEEFSKYGIVFISQESYEILFNLVLIKQKNITF
jgi:hypothetical protein